MDTKEEVIERVAKAIADVWVLGTTYPDSPSYTDWRDMARAAIDSLVGQDKE